MNHVIAALAAFVAGLAIAASPEPVDQKSRDGTSKMMPVPPSPVAPSASTMARGEVEKVDRGTRTITVKHGPLVNLGVPAMTSVFHVHEAAMLDQVKTRDKINFSVEKMNGEITITKVERAK